MGKFCKKTELLDNCIKMVNSSENYIFNIDSTPKSRPPKLKRNVHFISTGVDVAKRI